MVSKTHLRGTIRFFSIVACCALSENGLKAQTWDGDTDGDGDNVHWSDPLNWNGNQVPTGPQLEGDNPGRSDCGVRSHDADDDW